MKYLLILGIGLAIGGVLVQYEITGSIWGRPRFEKVEALCADPVDYDQELENAIWNCADYPDIKSWDKWQMENIYEQTNQKE